MAGISARSYGLDDCKIFEVGNVKDFNKRKGYYLLKEENNKCTCVPATKIIETEKNDGSVSCDEYCNNGINDETPIGSKCIIGKNIQLSKLVDCKEVQATSGKIEIMILTYAPYFIKFNMKNVTTNTYIHDFKQLKKYENKYIYSLGPGEYRFQIRDTSKYGRAKVKIFLDNKEIKKIPYYSFGYQTNVKFKIKEGQLQKTAGVNCYCLPNLQTTYNKSHRSVGESNPGGTTSNYEMIGFRGVKGDLRGYLSYHEPQSRLYDYYKENKIHENVYDQSFESKCGYNRAMTGMNWYTDADPIDGMGSFTTSRICQFNKSGNLDSSFDDSYMRDLSGQKEADMENTCAKFDNEKSCKKRSRCKWINDAGLCRDNALNNDFGPYGSKEPIMSKYPEYELDYGKTQNCAKNEIGLPFNYRTMCGNLDNKPLFGEYTIDYSCENDPIESHDKISENPGDIRKKHLLTKVQTPT